MNHTELDAAMDALIASDRYKAFIEREQAHGARLERERIARAIDDAQRLTGGVHFTHGYACAMEDAARIARQADA